ncbi:hypothetical protein [Paenibacillus macerans]|uniref:hypothetical protein n=1 Tax=Paenibacillus macerans TaxID=44252 RepID=UPI0022E85337|nr:hypothetical protein [Paenibacillus macerans]
MQGPHTEQVVFQHIPDSILENAIVYLAGSTIEGFGNATSDVDVFVISESLPSEEELNRLDGNASTIKENRTIVQNIVVDDTRYDFTYVRTEDFVSLITKLNLFNPRSDERPGEFDKNGIDFLHRLRFSRMLKMSSEKQELIGNVNFNHLNLYLAMTEAWLYSHVVEDLEGAYRSGDFGTAFFGIRKLLEVSLTMYLALHGETNPNPKWLYRKLLRYCKDRNDMGLLEKYMELQGHAYDESTIAGHLKNGLKFCQHLNERSQDLIKLQIEE